MATQNKIKTDFTLEYLRWRAGFRATAPSPAQFGITTGEARRKVVEVDICLARRDESPQTTIPAA